MELGEWSVEFYYPNSKLQTPNSKLKNTAAQIRLNLSCGDVIYSLNSIYKLFNPQRPEERHIRFHLYEL